MLLCFALVMFIFSLLFFFDVILILFVLVCFVCSASPVKSHTARVPLVRGDVQGSGAQGGLVDRCHDR